MSKKNNLLIAGAGRIGTMMSAILASDEKNHVVLVDIRKPDEAEIKNENIIFVTCDIANTQALRSLIATYQIQAIISCLPFHFNQSVAKLAKDENCHYFDLTEDVETTHAIFSLSKTADTAFVPQCGVAPGLINMMANKLILSFEQTHHRLPGSVKLYCGALPQKLTNTLGYTLNWSTEGLINEYINPASVLFNGKKTIVDSLTDEEPLTIRCVKYEAFHTSGGIGTLINTYEHKINSMYYKTLRYPGHCEKMRFLINELKLKNQRETLIHILENALPRNQLDFVITHVEVDELSDTRLFYPTTLFGIDCNAIQAVTSVSAAAVVNTVIANPTAYKGPIKQEDFSLDHILPYDLTGYLSQ